MRSLLFILIAILIGGCSMSGRHRKSLDEAERMMFSNPRGALERLNSCDVSEFEDSASLARWALLYSEALNVNRLTAPTDTIISVAIDYYSRCGNISGLAKAKKIKSEMISSGSANDRLATSLYLQKEKECFLFKERARRKELTYWLVIVAVMSLSVIFWQRQRIRAREASNDALIAEAAGMRCELRVQRAGRSELESKLSGLLESRFALIDSLCQTYYEWQGTKNERKAVAESVKEKIVSLKQDEVFFKEMAGAADDCCGGIATRLRNEFPEMKPDEFRLAVYIVCGLSSRTISLLLGESVENVYKRKSRLKSKLKAGNSPVAEDVLRRF